jgi:surface antigen
MRTFYRIAPIIMGTGALLVLLSAPAPSSLIADEPLSTGSVMIDAEGAVQPGSFAELRARLDATDRAVALNALKVALNELGDGASLLWRRPSRALTGVIKAVSVFRDSEGRVCRHVSYSLSLGTYVRQVEGVACREANGRWALSG